MQLWETGEKVVIFCHYRATGRALRLHVSSALHRRFLALGATKLSTADEASVQAELDRLGERLLDQESPVRRKVERSIRDIVRSYPTFDSDAVEGIVDVILRFLRTPSFLARYFPLGQRESAEAFAEAIGCVGADCLALEVKIRQFCTFLAERCIDSEREEYVQALRLIQTGTHSGHDVLSASDPAESFSRTEGTMLLPNVRLANGEVRDETRRRLLLAFNTPLFPEILVASSVLAEGVDLHLNCRHVIHHDLCWNPFDAGAAVGASRPYRLQGRTGQAVDPRVPAVYCRDSGREDVSRRSRSRALVPDRHGREIRLYPSFPNSVST